MDSIQEAAPYLCCGACEGRLTISNYPMQSSTCGHSICKQCFDSKVCLESSTSMACLICKEAHAFHPTHSKPNLLALAAVDMLKEYSEILKAKTIRDLLPESAQAARMPKTISTKQRALSFQENRNDKKNAQSEEESSPQVSKAVSHDHGEINSRDSVSSMESENSGESLGKTAEPNSPPTIPQGGRMVWVKFGKVNQLANLLSIKGEVATIRWESFKYEEQVSVDRIEEMDDNSTDRKRTRRVSTDKPSFRYEPQVEESKKKKQKKECKKILD